jgi:hypothetical protein
MEHDMTQMETAVNRKKLQDLYAKEPDVRAVLDHFANRERNQNTSTVGRLMVNVHVLSRGQIVRVFKVLEELGCGEFIAGRKGYESRFGWRVSSKNVARVAAGEEDEIEEDVPALVDDEDAINDELIDHRYHLRPNLVIDISLPADLSFNESKRLAMFIRTLPFAGDSDSTSISVPPLPPEDFSDWES